jgi:hypothetical protein
VQRSGRIHPPQISNSRNKSASKRREGKGSGVAGKGNATVGITRSEQHRAASQPVSHCIHYLRYTNSAVLCCSLNIGLSSSQVK